MDIDLIRAKEDSIARCVARVRSKAGLTHEQLLDDYDAQDVIVLNLERAVQQAVDIATHILAETDAPVPESMRDSFAGLRRIGALTAETADRMMKAVGFRNTAVHAYQAVDWTIVSSIVADRLSDFSDYVAEIDVYLEKLPKGR